MKELSEKQKNVIFYPNIWKTTLKMKNNHFAIQWRIPPIYYVILAPSPLS
jgi:hypothetical protein